VERTPGTWERWGISVGMDCTGHALQDEVVDSQRLFKLNNVNRQIMTLHLMIDYPILLSK